MPQPPSPNAPLADLLTAYLATGDERPMELLVARTEPKLRRIARRICGAVDADDCVQSAYLALLRRQAVPDGGAVEGWLVTTTTRLAYRRRSLITRQSLVAELLSAEGLGRTERAAELNEEVDALYVQIDRLHPSLRDPVILYYLESLSIDQVAQLLAISPNAVKQRLHRARAVLRSRLRWLHQAILLPALLWNDSLGIRVTSMAVAAVCVLTTVIWFTISPTGGVQGTPLTPPSSGGPEDGLQTAAPRTAAEVGSSRMAPMEAVDLRPASARLRGLVLAPGGQPLAGATVIAAPRLRQSYRVVDRRDLGRVPLDPHWLVAESGEDGRFEFDSPAVDGTQLCALHPEHLPSTFWTVDGLDAVTLRMRVGASIRGQALAGGRPCPGVTVAVYLPMLPVLGTRQKTTSDASGAFEIAGLVPGASYGLVAQAGDLVLGGHAETTHVVEAGSSDVRLELTPGATVAGIVRASPGEPLADVPISLLVGGPVPKLPPLTTTSGSDGSFSIAAVPAGPFTLTAAAPDGRHALARAAAIGGSRCEVSLALPALPPLRGRVESHAGLPVSGAHVRCTNGSLHQPVVPTGLDGRFALPWPEERVARLQVTVPGSDATAEAIVEPTVEPGQPVAIRLPPGPELHLRVVDEEDHPAPLVSVRFLGSPGERPLPFRDSAFTETRDGELRLPFPPRAAVAVVLRAPHSTSVTVDLPENAGEVTRLRTITLPRGVSLRGSVRCEEQPVPEAEVHLEPVASTRRSPRPRLPGALPDAVTGDHGRFLVGHLSPGTYELRVGHPTLADSVLSIEVGKTAPPPVVVELERGAAISGVVLDAAGAPIQGALVTARPEGALPTHPARWQAPSDATGRYRITGLPAGKVELTASDPRQVAAARFGHLMQRPRAHYFREVDLPPASEFVCDFGGEQLVVVAGRLSGWPSLESDEPRQISLENGSASVFTHVDERGEFELPGVPPGDYELKIVQDRHDLTRRLEISPATSSYLDLALPLGEIRGRVVGHGSTPAAQVTATLVALDGRTLGSMSVPCGGDGAFILHSLPAGIFELRAQVSGHPRLLSGPTVELSENESSAGHEIVIPR